MVVTMVITQGDKIMVDIVTNNGPMQQSIDKVDMAVLGEALMITLCETMYKYDKASVFEVKPLLGPAGGDNSRN